MFTCCCAVSFEMLTLCTLFVIAVLCVFCFHEFVCLVLVCLLVFVFGCLSLVLDVCWCSFDCCCLCLLCSVVVYFMVLRVCLLFACLV